MEEDAQPVQPAFPQTRIQITPEGMLVQVILAPGLFFTVVIGEEQMNQACKLWVQTRKDVADQMRMVERGLPEQVKAR